MNNKLLKATIVLLSILIILVGFLCVKEYLPILPKKVYIGNPDKNRLYHKTYECANLDGCSVVKKVDLDYARIVGRKQCSHCYKKDSRYN